MDLSSKLIQLNPDSSLKVQKDIIEEQAFTENPQTPQTLDASSAKIDMASFQLFNDSDSEGNS